MKLDTFRRLDDHNRRIRQLERTEPAGDGGGGGSADWADITGKPSTFPPAEHDTTHDDRFSLIAHTHPVHADSDHDDRFSLLAHVHAVAWGDITGVPATFPPTAQLLDWLIDVATAGQAATNVLTFNGTAWVPSAIPAQTWTSITGKPATFPPDEHDTTHDDRFSLLAHAHAGVYAPVEHDSAHDDRFSLLAHTHAAHADSDHDDRFSLLAHNHDWASITGKPSTFTPTPQALDWLTDVATTGQAATNVLTYNGSAWTPAAVPAQTWTSITGKPSTFPPDEHDSAHDDRFSLLAHNHSGTYVPAGQGVPAGGSTGQVLAKTSGTDYATGWQSASAPAPQPLDWLTDVATAGQTTSNVLTYNGSAWTPAAVPAQTWTSITGKPSTFTPAEHDVDHDDRFSLLAHTHTGVPTELAYVEMTTTVTLAATTAATSTLIVAAPAVTYTAVPHEVEFFCQHVSAPNAVGGQTLILVYDGSAAAPMGRIAFVRTPAASASQGWPTLGKYRFTPSAGSHTYQIRGHVNTGSGSVQGGAAGGETAVPVYIKITRL